MRWLLIALLLCSPMARAASVGVGGVVQSPHFTGGMATAGTGVIAQLIYPEALNWTILMDNNTTGGGVVAVQALSADGVTWYTLTAVSVPAGTVNMNNLTFVAGTPQCIAFEFPGNFLGIRVNCLTFVAPAIRVTISAL